MCIICIVGIIARWITNESSQNIFFQPLKAVSRSCKLYGVLVEIEGVSKGRNWNFVREIIKSAAQFCTTFGLFDSSIFLILHLCKFFCPIWHHLDCRFSKLSPEWDRPRKFMHIFDSILVLMDPVFGRSWPSSVNEHRGKKIANNGKWYASWYKTGRELPRPNLTRPEAVPGIDSAAPGRQNALRENEHSARCSKPRCTSPPSNHTTLQFLDERTLRMTGSSRVGIDTNAAYHCVCSKYASTTENTQRTC